ncbi:MAG TPA: hypothetical protein VFI08_11660, partial [Spirochaetia bacterium]|nr:hypothetical protein [Spirochaetia bacterium]
YRFDPDSAEKASTDWASAIESDQTQDKLAFRSIFQTALHPFPAVTELSTSSLAYRINARLYQIGLTPNTLDPYTPSVTTTGPEWNTDAISEHSLASTLAYVTPATSDSLGLTFQLPPLVKTMTGQLSAAAGVWSGKVQGGFSQPPGGIQYQPLVVSAGLDMSQGSAAASSTTSTTATTATSTTTTSTTTSSTSTGSTSSTSSTTSTTSPTTTPVNTALTATEELQFDVQSSLLTRSTSTVGYAGFSGQFMAQNTGTPNKLEAGTVKVGYESPWGPLWYWQDRIQVTPGLKTHWYMNLQNYIDNLFDFSPSVTVTVYNNLDITFSSTSNNTRTYLYFPSLSHMPYVSPLTDLWESFNFANNDDRRRSGFKIQNISLKVVQHFPDWDASVQYTGSPQQVTHTNAAGTQYVQNEWTPTFSILVQWKAFSEIKSTIHQEYTGTTPVPSLR